MTRSQRALSPQNNSKVKYTWTLIQFTPAVHKLCARWAFNQCALSGGNYWLIYEVGAHFSVGAGVHPRGISLPVLLKPHDDLSRGFKWRRSVVSKGKSTGVVQVSTVIIQETRLMLLAPQSVCWDCTLFFMSFVHWPRYDITSSTPRSFTTTPHPLSFTYFRSRSFLHLLPPLTVDHNVVFDFISTETPTWPHLWVAESQQHHWVLFLAPPSLQDVC